jgi:hypothetical protein
MARSGLVRQGGSIPPRCFTALGGAGTCLDVLCTTGGDWSSDSAMTCEKCGAPCKGVTCRECSRLDHQESFGALPSLDEDDGEEGADE